MHRPAITRICPKCGAPTARKIHRTFWMRLFPGSVRLSCSACGETSFLRHRLPQPERFR